MNEIRIILVEPAGALNVGSIARVMKNMGLSNLILVNPKCDRLSESARQMAVHAIDILEQAQIVPDLPQALQGCQRAMATTARSRALATKLESPKSALAWLIADNITSALIFGPEDRGLSNQELNYAQRFVGIPANPVYPSLNLAQAVAVCAYELYQLSLSKDIDNPSGCVTLQARESDNLNSVLGNDATIETLEGYYADLESLLLDVGYLYPHTATARMAKFRRLYNRANLTKEEVAMLRGIIRQIKWAINNANGGE
ncbi:MAG: RNA methyltransferase [Xenococcus sp. MO_188.B8]|nr:RNA methyltransferase [Xenococcus sp. MO_188.B8]